MRKKKVWMLISKDKYELPLAIADSPAELAEMLGTTATAIKSAVSHYNSRNHSTRRGSKYIAVEIDEDEDMDDDNN